MPGLPSRPPLTSIKIDRPGAADTVIMRALLAILGVLGGCLALAACDAETRPRHDYFDRQIQPLLLARCASGVSGCHRDDGSGRALGNLDVTSYEALLLRQDLLRPYGSYPEPLLLIKAVDSRELDISYRGDFQPLEVTHAGGAVLQMSGPAYLTLKRWLDNGATRDGRPPPSSGASAGGVGACSDKASTLVDITQVGADDPGYAAFGPAQDVLVRRCGQGSCHGSGRLDLQIACGSDEPQRRANYLVARAFVASPAEDSELLRRPLSPQLGGGSHGGGILFDAVDDPDLETLRAWALLAGPLPEADITDARRFFDQEVLPLLLRRGCAAQACHSPVVPHELKLRAGSFGFFSPIARAIDYREARALLALGSPNPRVSRIVAKNVLAGHGGLAHRAGALLETPGQALDPAACPTPYDPVTSPPVCALAEWLRLERAELPASQRAGAAAGTTLPLVWVERPADASRLVDFSEFRPGADLVRGEALLGANAALASVSGRTSLLAGCAGVGPDRAAIDVRTPEPSYDGTRVVFALRVGAASGLDVWEVGVDGSGCRRITLDGGEVQGGLSVHNFDPTYVVDDAGLEWIVYASSRGGPEGPRRTPKLLLPGADLWRQRADGSGAGERMTFLRGVEAQPGITAHGQLTMTAEKMSADFYQIAGRRLDWDLGDYHPLVGQRAESYQGRGGYLPGAAPPDAELVPSIGYAQVTESRSALDGNLLVVLADAGARGQGGALGVFNRSVGPFEQGRIDADYVRSLTVLPGPTGRAGEATGAYRSPFMLPDGTVLAAYAEGVDVGAEAPVRYDLVAVDPRTGARRALVTGPGSRVEAVLVMPRPPEPLFHRDRQPPDAEQATDALAVVHFLDLPLLATLLDGNDRRGRAVTGLRAATRVRFFAHAAPPLECTAADAPVCVSDFAGDEQVFEQRVELGEAPVFPDGSAYLRVPTRRPLLIELLDDEGQVLFRQREELQFGAREAINMGVPERVFGTTCAECHGSVSGRELDVHIDVDALTSASTSQARTAGLRDLE